MCGPAKQTQQRKNLSSKKQGKWFVCQDSVHRRNPAGELSVALELSPDKLYQSNSPDGAMRLSSVTESICFDCRYLPVH